MDQNQGEFLVELEELVELIFADLDELRVSLTEGRQRRELRQLVDRVFRRVHSVKGSAASSGLEVVSQTAHEFENLLDAVRSGRTQLDVLSLDTCVSATEAISESLSQAASGKTERVSAGLFDRLRAAARGVARDPGSETEEILSNIPSEIWQSLTQAEQDRLVLVVKEGTPLFLVATSFVLSTFDEEFFRLKEKLAANGEVISTSPTVDDTHPGKINFRVLYASDVETGVLQAGVIEFSEVVFNELQSAESAIFPEK